MGAIPSVSFEEMAQVNEAVESAEATPAENGQGAE